MLAVQWLLFSLALSSCNAWWSASPLQYAGIEQKGAAWNRWRPFSAKLVRCNSAHGFIPILRIPAGSIDDSSVIDFIHEWSRDQVMVGSTFTVQVSLLGFLCFVFVAKNWTDCCSDFHSIDHKKGGTVPFYSRSWICSYIASGGHEWCRSHRRILTSGAWKRTCLLLLLLHGRPCEISSNINRIFFS